jgi:flagellar biosynthesis protein FliQ
MEQFIMIAFSGFWPWLGAVIMIWVAAMGVGLGVALLRGGK